VADDHYRGVPYPVELTGSGTPSRWWRRGVDAALDHLGMTTEQPRTAANDGGQRRTACPSCLSPYVRHRSMGRFCHHTAACTWNGREP
jgi:hypothetical protein